MSLPDAFAARGVAATAQARYRLHFDLDRIPDEPWALLLSHVAAERHVSVNGTGAEPIPALRPARPVPALIPLSPGSLRVGRNEIDISVRYAILPGLSEAEIGPRHELSPRLHRQTLLRRALPQALSAAAFGVALLMLTVWWRSRTLVVVGTFSGLALIGTLRGMFTFVGEDGWVPANSAWLTYVSHLWSVVLLGAFAQAFSERTLPRFLPALVGMAAALTLVSLAADWHGPELLLTVRQWTYPIVIAATLPSLWICLERARRTHGWPLSAQALAAVALVGAGAHDYAMQTLSLLPVTHGFWMPYVLPLMVLAVAVALIDRIVAALRRVEGLTVELESRVAERTRDLEAANQAKSRFLASASHDLRQPLTSIGLLVGLAREQATSPMQQHVLEKADESVSAMEGLMSGLLDLSRLEGGAVRVRIESIALQDVWSAIETHVHGAAARKGLRLRFRSTTIRVRSDRVLVECIVRNLVVNAVRYTAQGGVLVAARRRQGTVIVEVRDTGIGIAERDLTHIFEEFVQLPTGERTEGIGLGLAIVRRSAALLNHKVSVRSTVSRGSCFAITFDTAEPLSSKTQTLPTLDLQAPLAEKVVVLVEDDESLREALRVRLQNWGAQVEVFDDLLPLKSWLDLPHANPDMAVCDFQLPSGTGLEAIAALRASHGYATLAVLITGDTAPADLAKFRDVDVPVLHKPFRSEVLLALLLERPRFSEGLTP